MNSTTVSTELGLHLVVPHEELSVPLMATLSYSAEDPYAVRISFHAGLDEPIEWVIGRELLSAGLHRPQGLGDAQVWPSSAAADDLADGVLNIELSSPYGHAHFEALAADVAGFLDSTEQVVPVGSESAHLDFDAELANLLREAL
jgi:hypothetical protein